MEQFNFMLSLSLSFSLSTLYLTLSFFELTKVQVISIAGRYLDTHLRTLSPVLHCISIYKDSFLSLIYFPSKLLHSLSPLFSLYLSKPLSTMTEGTMELGDMGTSLMASDSKKAPVQPPNKFERLVQPCLAELVGTMFFVFIGCVSVIENVEAAGRLQPALVHGLAVAVMVACMAEIRSVCLYTVYWYTVSLYCVVLDKCL